VSTHSSGPFAAVAFADAYRVYWDQRSGSRLALSDSSRRACQGPARKAVPDYCDAGAGASVDTVVGMVHKVRHAADRLVACSLCRVTHAGVRRHVKQCSVHK
jgi:hypothetical protein